MGLKSLEFLYWFYVRSNFQLNYIFCLSLSLSPLLAAYFLTLLSFVSYRKPHRIFVTILSISFFDISSYNFIYFYKFISISFIFYLGTFEIFLRFLIFFFFIGSDICSFWSSIATATNSFIMRLYASLKSIKSSIVYCIHFQVVFFSFTRKIFDVLFRKQADSPKFWHFDSQIIKPIRYVTIFVYNFSVIFIFNLWPLCFCNLI